MHNEIHSLTRRQQVLIGCGLALLMTLTRGLPLPGFELLPGASWAVFFLAGIYLQSRLALPVLLALAVVIDAIAIGWANVPAYCLTPAYAMLAPAYASLWLAGRWYSGRHAFAWRSLAPLAAAALAGAGLCELFSSASFYWYSGFFANPGFEQFQARELVYFPAYLASLAFWLSAVAAVHVALELKQSRAAGAATSAA